MKFVKSSRKSPICHPEHRCGLTRRSTRPLAFDSGRVTFTVSEKLFTRIGYEHSMDPEVQAWINLNKDAEQVAKKACARMSKIERDPFVEMSQAFLSKASQTLSAINVLYESHLEEPAQALIRILFELRVNFDYFLQMAQKNPAQAVERVFDSMMLEKAKQARASGFVDFPNEMKESLEKREREISSKYSRNNLQQIRRHGFTGLSIEQRAKQTGHEGAYNIVYRNFSRNVHATDYMESYLREGIYNEDDIFSYRASRDIAAHYTAHFSAIGMVEKANHFFSLQIEKEIIDLGTRQTEIKKMGEKP